MIGWRVYDVMRTIDWIETRKELDAKRVGCMGISGGGTCTTFSAALEPRINAAMVSGYLNTFRDSIMSVSHCIDNYVPGILNWAEMYDVAGLIAPRPLFVESGEKDKIFPIAASRESFARVKKVYAVFDAAAHRAGDLRRPAQLLGEARPAVPGETSVRNVASSRLDRDRTRPTLRNGPVSRMAGGSGLPFWAVPRGAPGQGRSG